MISAPALLSIQKGLHPFLFLLLLLSELIEQFFGLDRDEEQDLLELFEIYAFFLFVFGLFKSIHVYLGHILFLKHEGNHLKLKTEIVKSR